MQKLKRFDKAPWSTGGCSEHGKGPQGFHLGDVGGDAPRPVAGEELGRRSPAGLVLKNGCKRAPAR